MSEFKALLDEVARLRAGLERVIEAADNAEEQPGETQRLADVTEIAERTLAGTLKEGQA